MVFGEDVQAKIRANNRNWDARAPIHARSRFYGIGHLGVETMAFALKGARVTGLDFSCVSVREAQRVAREAGLTIDYVHADVYDAVEALGAERFDIV